ncbi:MAG: ABC transporter ATP-binding protein [Ferrovibrio sp.]|uniref:ABC transporter ATP-binding protein n=1 Tax=Ferrovibrio sp. TaxID=1917215 RepID=UPI002639390B|nr:ABC transporter ATP-binding protein [Ferrovibrio sp.]MCW0232063.1 ABC transporter ATP-binding protein [Ferrovibrio sp.]
MVMFVPDPAAPPASGALSLEALGMSKQFGALRALDDVTLKVEAGSFHALLGENGAGKSTLVKCIMGYYTPDTGQVMVGNHEQPIDSPRMAHTLGLGMVYQHFTLVPDMTVAENLVLARTDLPAMIDWKKEHVDLESFFVTMPFRVPLDRKVAALSAGEKQKTEILKQLYLKRRFLILDEPTSVLTPGEADEVLGLLRDMTRRNELTVLTITHKFREVFAFADSVTVLRRGRFAGSGKVTELTADDMAKMMMGDQKLPDPAPRMDYMGSGSPREETRLAIQSLQVADDAGQPAVKSVSLRVRAGEILGIAGVSGNGQRELVEAIAGQRDIAGGAIVLHGEAFDASRAAMKRHKLSCLPEEPLRNACVATMSVAENLAFRRFDEPPFAAGGWWLKPAAFREAAKQVIARYRVKTPGPDAAIGQLSGGNVQRAVLGREIGGDVNVLVAANPCFGLDFAAVADIHGQIMAARNRGAAVLLVSEDLDELFELSDRIAVMFSGRIVFEDAIGNADLTVIGRHMAGH